MNIYQLTPRNDKLEDKIWKISKYKGLMIVRAENLSAARKLAKGYNDSAHEKTSASELSLSSPWIEPDYVDCEIYSGNKYSEKDLPEILFPKD